VTETENEEPTQKTRPQGIDPATGKPYEPVDIPVPKREDIERLLTKAAKPRAK
jgi:hypothetical protein